MALIFHITFPGLVCPVIVGRIAGLNEVQIVDNQIKTERCKRMNCYPNVWEGTATQFVECTGYENWRGELWAVTVVSICDHYLAQYGG